MELILTALVILSAYLFFGHLKLKKIVAKLQEQILQLQGGAPKADQASEIVVEAVSSKDETITDQPKDTPWKRIEKGGSRSRVADETADKAVAFETKPLAAYVFSPEKMANLMGWLKENWFYAVAAISLALSGIFFVQYGIENGYLTPVMRVMGALGLGAALIGAGEWIRRKSGDAADSHTAYLPSLFSGAGLVALFAGVLAARQMYGLIGPEMAIVGLAAVSALAVVLGWFYGTLLAAVGIVGANLTPFLVGGNSENGWLFYYYFALIIVAGMLVDAIKRWAWVSTLTLISGFIAAWFIFYLGAGGPHFLGFALIGAAAAAMLPILHYWPQHWGEMVSTSLLRFKGQKPDWPEFPTRLATGGFTAAVVVAMLVSLKATSAGEVWLVLISLAVLFVMSVIWFIQAPALRDTAVLPLLAFLFVLFSQGEIIGSLYLDFVAGRNRSAEIAPPWSVSIITAMALAGSALVFWRSLREKQYRLIWTGGAALFAPLVLVVLETWWLPVSVLGKGLWAWHAMFVAIVMVAFALWCARIDGQGRKRVAIFALAAMTMISFALMVMLTTAALTLSIAVMVLLAALIDKQFDLRLLSVFVQVGGVICGYRLLADPGVIWAFDAPLPEFVLAYVGVIALFAGAWFILHTRTRTSAIVVMESAVWSLSGLFLSVALARQFDGADDAAAPVALFALVWLISAASQLYRLKISGIMRWVRIGLASIFGLIGLAAMVMVLTLLNPLFAKYEVVQGPFVFDTLMVAYLLPALLFGFVGWWFTHLHRRLRAVFAVLGAGLAALYLGLEIRRFWQGDILAHRGTTDGELYSYTVVMLLISVGLLFFGFMKRSGLIRRMAIIGIGLTIAKVFLIDMSGLTGLIRVASFLGLGLSLAGLAWVNRQMTLQWDQGGNDGGGKVLKAEPVDEIDDKPEADGKAADTENDAEVEPPEGSREDDAPDEDQDEADPEGDDPELPKDEASDK